MDQRSQTPHRNRKITSETAALLRRLMMIEARTVLSVQAVATIFRVVDQVVYNETAKGYPADLDPDLARDATEGTRVALRAWVERQAVAPGANRR